jgi:hypothetical protein
MATYDVKVVVEYFYKVEAENEAEAIDLGWKYEDYQHFGEVYSIDVTEKEDEDEDDN